MCKFIVSDRECKVPHKDGEYCHIHLRSVKLMKKIKAQADEITILNKRLSEANRKLYIIDRADRVKYELAPYVVNRSFRQAIDDPDIADEIERIFNAPQPECLAIYDSLINKRNMLTHRYTSRNWVDSLKKTRHGISVKQLCDSVKTYDILRS